MSFWPERWRRRSQQFSNTDHWQQSFFAMHRSVLHWAGLPRFCKRLTALQRSLLLAAVGIYGVLSGNVTERTREIGIRSALGASRRYILTLVLRQGIVLAALGVLIGLAGAFVASRALITLLFGVSLLDP